MACFWVVKICKKCTRGSEIALLLHHVRLDLRLKAFLSEVSVSPLAIILRVTRAEDLVVEGLGFTPSRCIMCLPLLFTKL